MQLNRLTLQGFRNYKEGSFSFDPRCNVIYGENAQGKTNLLDAIVFLSTGRGVHERSGRELIRFDMTSASLQAEISSRNRDFHVDVILTAGRQKKVTINGVDSRKNSTAEGFFHTVYFCPEDLQLIREGGAMRRRFLDQSLCQLRPRYMQALRRYQKLLENKNYILRHREERPDLLDTLPEFNRQLIQYGAVLIHYRARFIARLAQYASDNHCRCSGGKETLSFSYKTVKTVTDPFAAQENLIAELSEHQRSHERAEFSSGFCLSGPHKDDIEITINGINARTYASQGQARTAALAIKLAQHEIFHEITGEYPLLLLDDILSELDAARQEFVLNHIGGGQLFITCCEDDRLKNLLGGKIYHIADGRVIE